LSANVATTSWEVLTATALSYPIDGAYTNLKPTPDLEGVAVIVSVATVTSAIVFRETTLSVGFLPGSNLPSNAQVQVILPTEFAFAPITKTCSQITPSSAALTCTYSESGGYITSILVTNP